MNIIQTNHRPIAYEFVLLLLLVLLCCYCCYYYRFLLLLLATAVTTAVPCHCYYSLHCCYLLQFWYAGRWREQTISVNGQLLAPLIQSLGIVCRQQIVSDTVVIILLCLQILIFQVWLNLTHSAANTWEYPLTSDWRINKFGLNTLPSKTVAIPRAGGLSKPFF